MCHDSDVERFADLVSLKFHLLPQNVSTSWW